MVFDIKTKQESLKMINMLKLNKLPEIYLKKFDKAVVKRFLEEYDATYYAVRSKSQSGSRIFNFKLKKEEVIDYVKDLTEFTINVSSYGFSEHQLCTGEICIGSDLNVTLSVSNNPKFSARDGALKPDYNFSSTLENPKVKKIKGLKEVIDFIFKYELFDVIVEFVSFDIDVGTNNEKVVVFELRTAY